MSLVERRVKGQNFVTSPPYTLMEVLIRTYETYMVSALEQSRTESVCVFL